MGAKPLLGASQRRPLPFRRFSPGDGNQCEDGIAPQGCQGQSDQYQHEFLLSIRAIDHHLYLYKEYGGLRQS